MNPIMYWQIISLLVTAAVVYPIAFVAIRSANQDKIKGEASKASKH